MYYNSPKFYIDTTVRPYCIYYLVPEVANMINPHLRSISEQEAIAFYEKAANSNNIALSVFASREVERLMKQQTS